MMKAKLFIGMMFMQMTLIGLPTYGNDLNFMRNAEIMVVNDYRKVVGIKWQLNGFFSVESGIFQNAKPEIGEELWNGNQYTIIFNEDGTLNGHTFSNDIMGEYNIDGNTIVLENIWATKIGEKCDGAKFYAALYSPLTHIFEIRNGQLLLYYDEGKKYLLFDNVANNAQEYYPEGTKWTEIRLDTLKYDSWYSKVSDEWVPNFETIEYYVKGEYSDRDWIYKKVYTNGPEWTDSLTLLILEEGDAEFVGHDCVMVSVPIQYYDWNNHLTNGALWSGMAYQFDWSIGKGIYFEDIMYSNTTGIPRYYEYYGIIDEIHEGNFGGVRPLKYVDLDGKAPECGKWDNPQKVDTQGGRIIQGIGITEWNNGECLFGPPDPYCAWRLNQEDSYEERHYRSLLVHFERNGEVLYDVWPENGATDGMKSISKAKAPNVNGLFDLQGRRLNGKPAKGVYIENGRKRVK